MVEIIPSIIAFSKDDFLAKLKKVGDLAKKLHFDVMDGSFVASKTVASDALKGVKIKPKVEAHLMIEEPWLHVKDYTPYCDTVIFHYEACSGEKEALDTIVRIKGKKRRAGIAINPDTPVSTIRNLIPKLDQVVIMTVVPGQYGAPFVEDALKKIKQVRKLNSTIVIETDGSMKVGTARLAAKEGVNQIVVGSAIMFSENPEKAIAELRNDVKL
ncbi:ribulose-phosphate 3-epimerase [Candidatus Woesearchaeota archaeon]|nr:ribulose-phosphate 3-epimerase [Candidatus Woesearchaeota archaeon]